MYKAIIIDDEKMARTLLEGMLNEYCKDITIVESCKDLPTGVKAIRKLNPDLVFLDIEMPGHSGLELLEFFNDDEVNFSVIFTTAYNQYAIQAFKFSAIDYLLKPIEITDLETALERFRKQNTKQNFGILKDNLSNTTQQRKLAIYTTGSIKFVDVNEILFFKADGAYTRIVLNDESEVLASKSLKTYEDILTDTPFFFRCHKSFIVNLHYITEYVRNDGGYALVNKTHQVSVSTDKLDTLLSLMSRKRK
jgi:two-component system LytT family response regulator